MTAVFYALPYSIRIIENKFQSLFATKKIVKHTTLLCTEESIELKRLCFTVLETNVN